VSASTQQSGKVIVFYSYKGGTGRTMALANLACLLASREEKQSGKGILMIDWDLEAPSLHRYFHDCFENRFGNNHDEFRHHPGLIDFFEALNGEIESNHSESVDARVLTDIFQRLNIDSYIIQSDIPSLHLLKAGCFNKDYPERVTRFNWEKLFNRSLEKNLFQQLMEHFTQRYSYVLIDSRAGITDQSSICTAILPDKLVTIFTPNLQSLEGLSDVIKFAVDYRKENTSDLRPLIVYPLLSRVELAENDLRTRWRSGDTNGSFIGYQRFFEEMFQEIYPTAGVITLDRYFDEVQIRQSTFFAYGEKIAVRTEQAKDSLSLTRAYESFLNFLSKRRLWDNDQVADIQRISHEEIQEIERHSAKASTQRSAYDWLGALLLILKAARKIQQVERTGKLLPKNIKKKAIDRLKELVKIGERNRFEGHGDDIWDISFHPSGNKLVSASYDRTIRIWQLDGQLLKTFTGAGSHKSRVRSVNFSPDGNYIVSGSDDRTVKLWDVNGNLIRTFEGHFDRVFEVQFSPDGKLIASCSADRSVILWKVEGEMLHVFKEHNDMVWSVSFSPDGKFLATGGDDSKIYIWQCNDINQVYKSYDYPSRVFSVCFSPDSTKIAVSGVDRDSREPEIIDLISDTKQKLKGHQEEVLCITFSPDGKQLATASGDGTIRIWSLDGAELHAFRGHRKKAQTVQFHPNGILIASGGDDNTIRIWQLPDQQQISSDRHNGTVNTVCFSPDGQEIATAGDDRIIKLWNLNGTIRKSYPAYPTESIRSLCYQPASGVSQKDRLMATASDDGGVLIWTREHPEQMRLEHGGRVRAVSFSADGKYLASGGSDQMIKIWNSAGKFQRSLTSIHKDWVTDIQYRPNQTNQFASASADGTIALWDILGTYHQIIQVAGNEERDWVYSIAFSPDGSKIAAAFGKMVKIWQLDNGDAAPRLLATCREHRDFVYCVCFMPSGEEILSASHDMTVRKWSIFGDALEVYSSQDPIRGLAINPDGDKFVTTSNDGSVKLWTFDHSNAPIDFPIDTQEPTLEELTTQGCALISDYLKTNTNLNPIDRMVCEALPPITPE
jgi:WD40 repeat protein/cellulose biosynthesis protein BcsQ